MASGSGFIMDMNNKIKQNKELRNKRKNYFDAEISYSKKKNMSVVSETEINQDELNAFREKIKTERRKDFIFTIIKFAISLIITILLICFALYVFG